MSEKQISPFQDAWQGLVQLRDRALSGGPVQTVYFNADDLRLIGRSLLDSIFGSHPELPQNLGSIFEPRQSFDFALSVLQKLFGEVSVRASFVPRLHGRVQVWYEIGRIEEIIIP